MSDALAHLDAAVAALCLEAYRGRDPESMTPVEHFTIGEDLKRIDSQIGPTGESIFARIADNIEAAYVELLAARALIAAGPPAKVRSQVKPLRWKGPDSSGEYHSLDGLWGYIVRAGTGNGIWLTEVGSYFPSVEAAQAAAWSDYERRISVALIDAPSANPHVASDVAQRILGCLDDYASMPPENDEDWESWYRASFDLAREKVKALLATVAEASDNG